MKRTIFVIAIDHAIDLITNSSSELFVLEGKTSEIVEEMVKNIYPDYLNEYNNVKPFKDLTSCEVETYLSYHFYNWSNRKQKNNNNVVPGFTFDEMYEPSKWDLDAGREPSYYIRDSFCKDNLEAIKKAIDPDNKMYFMFSIDENPDWEMQEKLMTIGERYHLG